MSDHTSQRASFWTLITLLVFFLQMHGTYAQNPLRLDPPSIVVLYESPAFVTCSTNVTDTFGIGWEASQGPVDMKQDVQLINWTVKSVTHWDIKPICYINYKKGQYELPLNITVYKPPDRVSISTVSHDGPMIEGSEYMLQCDVHNVAPVHLLTVNWYKGQQKVSNESFSNETLTPLSISSTLNISLHRSDDGVQYRCEAELKLGPDGPQPPPIVKSDPLNITVNFGPEVLNCPDVLRLNEGESLAGYCNVTGKPFPHSYWVREGLRLDPSIPLNRTSSGEYKIVINGNATKSLEVEVMYGPEISCGHNYEVQEGEYFIPNCMAVGFPPTETMWYKDGDMVEFPQTMTKADAGQYTLIASNSKTSVNHTLEINVLYPPSEITELQKEQVSSGNDVVLKCSSNANPRPTYKWIYHQTSNVHVTNQDGVSLLHIKRAGGDNIGTYVCIAYNELGEKNQTVRVDVQGAKATCPLSISRQLVELEYGQSTQVQCNSPEHNANLTWEFSNTKIKQSTLTINSTLFNGSLAWAGKASCHGKFVGLDDCQKDVDVKIYKLPDKVHIWTLDHAGPMISGKDYTLQCDITSVSPPQNVSVNWYKGQDLMKAHGSFQETGSSAITSKLKISPSRDSTKVQYSCEAELKLGPESSHKVKSNALDITVHYKPVIKKKGDQQVPVFHGYPEVLVCEASGNPEPTITWTFNNKSFKGGNLTVTENGGLYTCFANNSVGNDTKVVTVVIKVDYLPLIAGFVALVVVITSIIFISVYSIYYKNTKMGHYTVEGAEPKAQNGNVAQNGKDSTIPMKKIML